MIKGVRKNQKEVLSAELHLHVLQAMGLVEPQYSHCFLATEVDVGRAIVVVALEDPFGSVLISSGVASTQGSGSALVNNKTRRPSPLHEKGTVHDE